MYIRLRNGEDVLIEADRGKVTISADYSGVVSIDGCDKYKKIDDITFEKAIEKLKKKITKDYKDNTKEEIENKLMFITRYIKAYHNHFKLDKTVLLESLERNRDYNFFNYYQPCNFPDYTSETGLKIKIGELQEEIFDLKHKRDEEIIKLQKELTEAKKIIVDKKEVETYIDFSTDINVNCPFCDEWQSVDIIDYEGENEYETNHECEKCGKIFSVKAIQ